MKGLETRWAAPAYSDGLPRLQPYTAGNRAGGWRCVGGLRAIDHQYYSKSIARHQDIDYDRSAKPGMHWLSDSGPVVAGRFHTAPGGCWPPPIMPRHRGQSQ